MVIKEKCLNSSRKTEQLVLHMWPLCTGEQPSFMDGDHSRQEGTTQRWHSRQEGTTDRWSQELFMISWDLPILSTNPCQQTVSK